MYLELFIIILIVVISFILCMNDKGYECQMSHVLMGLSVLLIYKVVKYFNLFQKLEPFSQKQTVEKFNDDLTKQINNFIGLTASDIVIPPNEARSLSESQLNNYNSQIASLNQKLTTLQELLINPPANTSDTPINLTTLDYQALQQYQNFQIDYLQKQIKNAQNVFNNQKQMEASSKYKPIKVFSSCKSGDEMNEISPVLRPGGPTAAASTVYALDDSTTQLGPNSSQRQGNVYNALFKYLAANTQ